VTPAPEAPRSAGDMVRMAREFLERKGVEAARLEAELLVAHALGLDRLRLFLQLDRPVSGSEVDRARDLLVRRGRREPTAYIVGSREFFGRPFKVGPGVLIPRPETELLVDRAREHARGRPTSPMRIADLGTGSGCIAVTLALEIEGADVTAIERSGEALAFARGNAEALGARIRLVEGDFYEALGRETAPFDLLVCNPPYVDPEDRATLSPEVSEHEPAVALFAPAGDPDFFVRTLLERASAWLARDGTLLVELGIGQAERLRGCGASFHRDLAGIERVLEAKRERLAPSSRP
jgi:release factor glutamine methyltransferase